MFDLVKMLYYDNKVLFWVIINFVKLYIKLKILAETWFLIKNGSGENKFEQKILKQV